MNFVEGEILAFDKPYRWTSFDVVGKARWLLCKKLGVKKLKVIYSKENKTNSKNFKKFWESEACEEIKPQQPIGCEDLSDE